MSERAPRPENRVTRRSFLGGMAAATAALAVPNGLHAAIGPTVPAPDPAPALRLKRAAQQSGILLGTYTVAHQLAFDPVAGGVIASAFGMIADGNDLKFSNRLRPTPDTFDFTAGDAAVAWAEQHGLLFRAHCMVWWNALPRWFGTYVNAQNARDVLTGHITKTVEHYRGRIYSWDVVNECIYHDNRPDGLRKKPWLDFLGPEYIDLAFHTARAADPKARLLLNECYIEHAVPGEVQRRDQLLALATRLHKAGVPITGVGIQGHLHGPVPTDKPGMTRFMQELRDQGLEVHITELDVDATGVAPADREQLIAQRYGEFVELVAPYATSITLEGLNDDPSYPKTPEGTPQRPNLLDVNYRPDRNYDAVLAALEGSARNHKASPRSGRHVQPSPAPGV